MKPLLDRWATRNGMTELNDFVFVFPVLWGIDEFGTCQGKITQLQSRTEAQMWQDVCLLDTAWFSGCQSLVTCHVWGVVSGPKCHNNLLSIVTMRDNMSWLSSVSQSLFTDHKRLFLAYIWTLDFPHKRAEENINLWYCLEFLFFCTQEIELKVTFVFCFCAVFFFSLTNEIFCVKTLKLNISWWNFPQTLL